MTNFVFESTGKGCYACANSREKLVHAAPPRILRTCTEEICVECGEVLQRFPKVKSLHCVLEADELSIPEPVALLVAELLKRRLFHFDYGRNPRSADSGRRQTGRDSSNAPNHRVSQQALIELSGFGNVFGVVRWSYSSVEQYQQSRQDNFGRPLKSPVLEALDVSMPTRIQRALEVVSDGLTFTGLHREHLGHKWCLRFEKDFRLEQQPFELGEFCLVVKLELSWLKVGESFPSGRGPREYYCGQNWNDLLTLEEALDRALVGCNGGTASFQHSIYSSVRRGIKVFECALPVSRLLNEIHGDPRYFQPDQPSSAWLAFRSLGNVDPMKTWIISDGRKLLPPGVELLGVDLRATSAVSLELNGSTLLERDIAVSAQDRRFPRHVTIDVKEVLADKLGRISIRIKNADENLVFEYDLVSAREHERTWEKIVERFKRRTLGEVRLVVAAGAKLESFSAQQQIAANIGGRWLEGRYVCTTVDGGIHRVEVVQECGVAEWDVFDVISLTQALMQGYDVVPPYNWKVPLLEAKLVRVHSVESFAATVSLPR